MTAILLFCLALLTMTLWLIVAVVEYGEQRGYGSRQHSPLIPPRASRLPESALRVKRTTIRPL